MQDLEIVLVEVRQKERKISTRNSEHDFVAHFKNVVNPEQRESDLMNFPETVGAILEGAARHEHRWVCARGYRMDQRPAVLIRGLETGAESRARVASGSFSRICT